MKTFITSTLDEYLVITHADETAGIFVSRLADSSKQLSAAIQVEIVKRSVYLVLDRKLVDGERLGSLLSQLYFQGILSSDSIERGLRVMCLRLPDLGLDNKFAGQALVSFATWLVVSDVLDEDFLAASSSAALYACAHDAQLDGLTPGEPLPPYIAALHDQLQHSLRSRLPHPLLAIRGMQREALASYLASGGMGLEPYVMDVFGPETVGGIGQAAGYSKHELARSLWLAQLEPERAAHEAAHCMKLPPKRPQLRRAHDDDAMDVSSPGGQAGGSPRGHGGNPVPPLTMQVVRELISQLIVELHGMGLLSPWDIATGAFSALCKASAGVGAQTGAAMAHALARAMSDGVMQEVAVRQPLPRHAFSNEWARYLAAERIYTGEWVVVREPAPAFTPQDPLVSPPQVLAMAGQGGAQGNCWGWNGASLKDIGVAASTLGKAVVSEVSSGGDGRVTASAGVGGLAAKAGGMDVGAREAVRVALVEAATGGKAPAARIAAALQSFSLPEPALRMGCLLAVDSLYASLLAGTGRGEHARQLGDVLGHLVAAGVITGGDALWSSLPRRLLLAAKLDSEGGEAGEEYLSTGSAAALLTVLKARVAAIAGKH